MYSLRILFFTLPLYFSHIFAPFGITIGESYSFERYKVYLFLLLIVFAYIEGCIYFPHKIYNILYKYSAILGALCIFPIISVLYFQGSIDINWLWGSYEKHHGYLFYIGIIFLIPVLMASSQVHLKSYLSSSIYAAMIVALIAIGEYVGGILDIYDRADISSAYIGRSVSTLGNPNYVAGYLLVFLPLLLTQIHSPQRWMVIGIFVFAILTTGGYIAIALLGLYIFYCGLRYLSDSMRMTLIVIFLVSIMGGYIGSLYLDPDKLLSLSSRFVLMQESLSMMLRDPVSLLIGFGPDTILTHFAHGRSLLVNAYFPENMNIDSSHNIWIDIWYQYGIFPLGLIFSCLIGYRKYLMTPIGSAILLLLIFLTLNVLVVSHVILLCLLFVLLIREQH